MTRADTTLQMEKGAAMSKTILELAYLSASEQIDGFRKRSISPVEVLDAQIERYGEVGERINAVTDLYFDDARAAARGAERRYASDQARPLEGVTCALKDEDGLAGWRVTSGSVLLKDHRLAEPTPVAERLEAAGAIFHMQTTAPEFYFIPLTWSKLFGVTRNPWNLRYTVGGSSGGSGAALAGGLTSIASGSDMGGSIRIPSSFNGTYGFKPPHGRVPVVPGWEVMPQGTSGPMTRTLTDLALMQSTLTGPHPRQMTALRPALGYPSSYPGIEGWRIAYSLDQGWARIDPDVRANTEAAIAVLRDQGAIVEPVEIRWDQTRIRSALLRALLSSAMGSTLIGIKEQDRSQDLTSYAAYFIGLLDGHGGPQQLADAQEVAAQMHSEYDALFEQGYRALVCPTVATAAVEADFDFTTGEQRIDGDVIDPLGGWILTPPFNLMYTIPVVNVPTGLDRHRVPTGMQIAARAFDDLSAFQVAAAFSAGAPTMFKNHLMPDFRGGP